MKFDLCILCAVLVGCSMDMDEEEENVVESYYDYPEYTAYRSDEEWTPRRRYGFVPIPGDGDDPIECLSCPTDEISKDDIRTPPFNELNEKEPIIR